MRIKCNLFANFRDFDERRFRKFRTSAGGPGAETPEHGGFSRTNGDSFKKISIELLFFMEGFLTNLLNFSRK